MQKIEYKKSAVDLTEMAIGVIILGIVVSIGAYMLTTYRDSRLTDLTVVNVVNETITGFNETAGDYLAKTWVKSITAVKNSTGGQSLASGNYTTSIDGVFGTGLVKSTVGSEFNGLDVKVDYSYYNTTSRQDWTLAGNASTGLLEYGNWFKIIVIVGVAAVVLALIFMSFGNKNAESGQGY